MAEKHRAGAARKCQSVAESATPAWPSARLADLVLELEALLDDVADIDMAVGPQASRRPAAADRDTSSPGPDRRPSGTDGVAGREPCAVACGGILLGIELGEAAVSRALNTWILD
jgi:hypothetical protein